MKSGHWATLNDEGKKLYGDVFPDSEVPIVSMIGQWAKLGGKEEPEQIYMIRVSDLTSEQFNKILDKVLARNPNSFKDEIRLNFEKENIPLRQSLTSGTGTNDSGFMACLMDDYGFEEDEEENRDSDPENCNMGSFAPGTEECDFCASSEYCAQPGGFDFEIDGTVCHDGVKQIKDEMLVKATSTSVNKGEGKQ